ncbi:DUF937 domain-containing protein [Chthonobacter rhizosphaerae]|uniref:DUF937 domain-containing protein n=1 Tax=Chthonobacter rhizosphaerae TaxID=2735553 RepID=UPI0015EFCC9F|nr:DUF937 domain-containing protein [Chthonobacter rhizosphaerae]
MFTFADLMRQAQGGQAIDNIAAAYGLKRTDVEKLMMTLLPLYSLGLKKSLTEMTSPATVSDLLDPDKFRAAFEDARAAVSPAATEAGRIALERMFGSGEAASVIAEQAAAATGVGADVVSKVMPTMAATVFGGVVKQIEESPFAPVMKAWSGPTDDAASPFDVLTNPYKDAMKAFLKGYAEGKPKKKSATGVEWPEGMETWGKLFDAGFEMNEASRKAFEKVYGIKLG